MAAGTETLQATASDEVKEMFCEPCADEDVRVIAEGFCTKCLDFLCKICIKYHKKLKKKHEVLNKTEMPQDVCLERCTQHNAKLIKYYCTKCEVPFCSDCQHGTETDSQCSRQHILQAANDFSVHVKETVNELAMTLQRAKNAVESKSNAENRRKVELLDDVENEKNRIIQLVQSIADTMKNSIQFVSSVDERQYKDVLFRFIATETKADTVKRNLEKLSVCKLLLAKKDVKCDLDKIRKEITDTESFLKRNHKYDFKTVGSLQRANAAEWFGSLVVSAPKVPDGATKSKLLNVRVSGLESVSCNITGLCILSSDKLIVADNANKTVKVINKTKGCIGERYVLESAPWDVTVIHGKTVAATCPESGTIVFIELTKSHSRQKVEVNKFCRGIEYTGKDLAVSYSKPGRIVFYDVRGNMLRKIEQDNNGATLFEMPWYLAYDESQDAIYVTDCLENSVTCLSKDGQVLSSCKPANFANLFGVALDFLGNAFICAHGSDMVCLFTSSFETFTSVIKPQACAYCFQTRQLIVSENKTNTVKVFDISYQDLKS